jgi:hypothetical protein
LGKYIDVWGPVCRGETLPVEQIIGESAAAAGLAAAVAAAAAAEQVGCITSSSGSHYSSWAAAAAAGVGLQEQQQQAQQAVGLSLAAAATAAEVAAFEKGLKQRLMLAVDHFNKDYKKGFQFLQVRCSLCCAGGFKAVLISCFTNHSNAAVLEVAARYVQ